MPELTLLLVLTLVLLTVLALVLLFVLVLVLFVVTLLTLLLVLLVSTRLVLPYPPVTVDCWLISVCADAEKTAMLINIAAKIVFFMAPALFVLTAVLLTAY